MADHLYARKNDALNVNREPYHPPSLNELTNNSLQLTLSMGNAVTLISPSEALTGTGLSAQVCTTKNVQGYVVQRLTVLSHDRFNLCVPRAWNEKASHRSYLPVSSIKVPLDILSFLLIYEYP